MRVDQKAIWEYMRWPDRFYLEFINEKEECGYIYGTKPTKKNEVEYCEPNQCKYETLKYVIYKNFGVELKGNDNLFVTQVYVNDEFRGRGICKMMMDLIYQTTNYIDVIILYNSGGIPSCKCYKDTATKNHYWTYYLDPNTDELIYMPDQCELNKYPVEPTFMVFKKLNNKRVDVTKNVGSTYSDINITS
jgi:predicted GNAT family acetyltransferase